MAKTKKTKREAVMVYRDPGDRNLLERLARMTGLPRTELRRRGLRYAAGEELASDRHFEMAEFQLLP